MNRLLHTGHANRFSPVCVRKCRCNSSDRVNRLPQNNQLHTNGLSPVCHRRCALRWDVLPYTLPQPGMWQLCTFFLRWPPAGPSRSASWQLGQSHVARPVYRRCVRGDGVWGAALYAADTAAAAAAAAAAADAEPGDVADDEDDEDVTTDG